METTKKQRGIDVESAESTKRWLESTKRSWNQRRESRINKEKLESTKRQRNQQREAGINEETAESTIRRRIQKGPTFFGLE